MLCDLDNVKCFILYINMKPKQLRNNEHGEDEE